jgi:hypothetical protein
MQDHADVIHVRKSHIMVGSDSLVSKKIGLEPSFVYGNGDLNYCKKRHWQ